MDRGERHLSVMIAAARAAGDGLRQDFSRIPTLEVVSKSGPNDLCSSADLRAEETVFGAPEQGISRLRFLRRGARAQRGCRRSCRWIVDPLDGTMNFLRGMPTFAVNIAFAEDGQIIAGVTYLPMFDEMFWAQKGQGTFLNGKRIQVSRCAALEEAVISVGIPFSGKPPHDVFAREMALLTPRQARSGAWGPAPPRSPMWRAGEWMPIGSVRCGHGTSPRERSWSRKLAVLSAMPRAMPWMSQTARFWPRHRSSGTICLIFCGRQRIAEPGHEQQCELFQPERATTVTGGASRTARWFALSAAPRWPLSISMRPPARPWRKR